jgi:hypothetical protein
MTDITERLRSRQWQHQGDAKHWALRDEAADEIDRLRDDRNLEKRWRKDSDDRAQALTEECDRLRDELTLCCELKREYQARAALGE